MGPQNIHPHPPPLENAFWPEMGEGGGGAYIISTWINFLENQSGRSEKVMLGKVYVRNSLSFRIEKGQHKRFGYEKAALSPGVLLPCIRPEKFMFMLFFFSPLNKRVPTCLVNKKNLPF